MRTRESLERRNRVLRHRHHHRLATGQCTRCPGDATPGYATCAECRAKRRRAHYGRAPRQRARAAEVYQVPPSARPCVEPRIAVYDQRTFAVVWPLPGAQDGVIGGSLLTVDDRLLSRRAPAWSDLELNDGLADLTRGRR